MFPTQIGKTSYSTGTGSNMASIALLTSIMLLGGFGVSLYASGTEMAQVGLATTEMVAATSAWTHATTASLKNQYQFITEDSQKLLGTAISITIIAVGIIGLFLNATGLLVNGDATHDPVISGAGASLLSTSLIGLIIAAGLIYMILRAFGVFG